MNNTLRTVIRFSIILIFLILLVFLSIALFKLIPKAINQLANASLSITGQDNIATTTVVVDRTPQYVATTTGGLNGVISQPNPTPATYNNTPTRVVTTTAPRTVYRTVYYPPVIPRLSGLKNIKVTLTSVGIISKSTGQFVSTNSFNTNDMISVRYRIVNDQDTATGPWNMRVEMPATLSDDRIKYINDLDLPGNGVYNVEARFDGVNTTSNAVVRIYTDIYNQVAETNENDNTLFVSLNNINNYNNNYNCNYYNNCNNNNNNYDCNYYNNCNNNTSLPNLMISSIETGKMINNVFSAQTNFVYGDKIALRVRVRNNGGSFTNTWSTRTNFYDNNGSNRTVVTDNERYLSSGEETVLTIQTNDVVNRGTTVFNFNLDTNNTIYESNEGDNHVSVSAYVY